MGKIEFEYCDRCGNPFPPDYLKEKNGLLLCPECYREPYPLSELALDYERDLFEQMAECFKPENIK